MGDAETNNQSASGGQTPATSGDSATKTSGAGDAPESPASAAKSRLLMSDARTPTPGVASESTEAEQKYWVDGKSVSLEEYTEALPKAGFIPERMPKNFYPAINTK